MSYLTEITQNELYWTTYGELNMSADILQKYTDGQFIYSKKMTQTMVIFIVLFQ